MWGRRIGYLASVLGCLILYLYCNQWAAWVLFWWLLALPVCSLLLSIPAMKSAEFSLECPTNITAGEAANVQLEASCRWPLPAYKCVIRIRHCITGQVFTCQPGETLLTEHCGGQEISIEQLRFYDYFGLFYKNIKTVDSCVVYVEPKPLALQSLPDKHTSAGTARPKRGGGFSEDHDLRPYIPGDDLRQIHWKLTAKTGSYVVREPLEQLSSARLLTVVLSGSRDEIDRKLGRLLWLSGTLLDRAEGHQAAVLSGRGLERFFVTDPDSLKVMISAVLTAPRVDGDMVLPAIEDTQEQFAIGGDADG